VLDSSTGSARRRLGLRVTASALAFLISALVLASPAVAATFNPNLVISDDNMRDDDSMTAADIQAFLVMKNSLLASRSFPRHDKGTSAPASVIIYEACRAFRISPKVMLVMLQKEQSLITRTPASLKTGWAGTLDWAIGMGCPDSGTRNEKYRGFGNQMWYGTQRLDGYGEGKNGSTIPLFVAGKRYGPANPANIATYKLYVYNPSVGASKPWPSETTKLDLSGNANFWVIHWRFFGDPFANPALRPVYSFQDRRNGSYSYTMSPAEKYRLSASKYFSYRGAITSINTSGGANPTPVHKFLNRKTKVYTYTISGRTKRQRLARPKTYSYRGVAFTASTNPAGRPVYRFVSKKNGADVLAATESKKRAYQTKANRKKYRYAGVAFYVMP
jgi:hypothetical protein